MRTRLPYKKTASVPTDYEEKQPEIDAITDNELELSIDILEKRDDKLTRQVQGMFFGFRETFEHCALLTRYVRIIFRKLVNLEREVTELKKKSACSCKNR